MPKVNRPLLSTRELTGRTPRLPRVARPMATAIVLVLALSVLAALWFSMA